MIDLFCNIYSSVQDKNLFLRRIRFYSVLRAIIRLAANIVLPIYLIVSSHNKNYSIAPSKNKTHIIVSLTSFPARIQKIWMVIETLLRQTVRPDRIILWLSKEQFDSFNQLPKQLVQLQNRGLEIIFVDGNIRSHKKYVYAMSNYLEDIIITVDDDIFYPTYVVKRLIETHISHPKDVITNIAHRIRFDSSKNLLPYNLWEQNIMIPNYAEMVFQVGVGGVLYPPHCVHKDICNTELSLKYCPFGDDIWLFAMCRLNGTVIRTSTATYTPLPIINRNDYSLSKDNLQGRNDQQILQLIKYCIDNYNQNPFA